MPCKACGNVGTDAVGIRNGNGVRIEVKYKKVRNCNTNESFFSVIPALKTDATRLPNFPATMT